MFVRFSTAQSVPELPKAASSGGYDFEEMRQLLIEKKSAAVDALAADARGQGVRAAGKVLMGRTSAAIIDEVAAESHDLVMKESRAWTPGPRTTGTRS
jgi:hypothetical protein